MNCLRRNGSSIILRPIMPPKIPPTLTISIWTLRSVPIVLALMTMSSALKHSAEIVIGPSFWWNGLALGVIIMGLLYLDRLGKLSWPVGQAIYLYVFVAMILQDANGVVKYMLSGHFTRVSWQEAVRILWLIASISVGGLVVEALVVELIRLKKRAWQMAVGLSVMYILSIVFFLPGTLSLWCLCNWETRSAFKKKFPPLQSD
jgi:hypothetical protein